MDIEAWARKADSGGLLGKAIQAGSLVWPGLFWNAVMRQQQGMEPSCTLSFDIDFPRDVEALDGVLRLLEEAGVRASFACIGQWVRRFPAEHRALVAAGHELVNHTETHPNLYHPAYDYASGADLNRERFNAIAPSQRRREIEACHATLVEVLGYTPKGFRTPHFGALHVDDVYPMLVDMGYAFSSSMKAAASPGGGRPYLHASGIWEFPVSPCPCHPLGVFDSWHSLSKKGASHRGPGELAELAARMCRRVSRDGGYFNFYLDPRDALDSGELKRLLEVLAANGLPPRPYGDLLPALADSSSS